MSQEDAHNAILDFDTNSSLFAVYDGHGGHEVAVYTAKHLPNFIKKNSLYLKGQIDEAMVESFVEFDRTITSAEVVAELKKIVGSKGDSDDEDRDPQELSHLCEEASMPIEAVLTKYVSGEEEKGEGKEVKKEEGEGSSGSSASKPKAPANPAVAALQKAGGSKPISPFLRAKANTPAKDGEKDSDAKQTLDFKEEPANGKDVEDKKESEEVKKEEDPAKKEDEPVKQEDDENKEEKKEKGSEEEPPLTKIKVKDNEEEDKEVVVNGTNGHHESNEEPITNGGTASDVKGKGKGKGKGKSSSVVRPAKDGEDGVTETPPPSPPSASKKTSPKKSAEELYKGLLSDEPEDEMDSEDEEDGAFGNSDDDDTEDTEDDEAEDVEDESDSVDDDDDDDEEDGFMCGPGRDYAEMPGNDSGCTAVVALLRGTTLYVANAGDSRCVVCRDGQAVEMSFDHKPEDEPEMKRIEAAGGKVTPDGRVNGGLNLSRAIGDHTYKTNKTLPLQDQMISPVPDVKTLQLDTKRDSFILLACDGIWNSLSSQETVDFVQQRLLKLENEAKKDPSTQQLKKICEELFDYCLAPDTVGDGTGCDNMTAVLVKLRPAFEDKPETGPEPVEAAAAAESSSTGTKPGGSASSAESTATSNKRREATEEGEEEQSAEQQQPAKKTQSGPGRDSFSTRRCRDQVKLIC